MEKVFWFFTLVLGLVSSFFFVFSWKRCARQCVLFGHVNDVKRIHTGGSQLWCLFCFGGSFQSVIISVVMLLHIARFGGILYNTRYIRLIKICLMWTFLTTIITSLGFRKWCNTFQINSCHLNSEQDWHAFTPHHSDCFGAFIWLSIKTACLWLSWLCQVCFYYKYVIVGSQHSRIR